MSKRIDFKILTGKRYGRLVVTGVAPTKHGRLFLWCLCDCGKPHAVDWRNLRNGGTNSCGCLKREQLRKKLTSHGFTGTRIHRIWRNMLTRCTNANTEVYKHYGARGIKVCQRWSRFEAFLEDMGCPPSNKHCLERKNNDLGYSKENCTWATYREQANNTRRNRFIEKDGARRTVSQWARMFNLSPQTITSRLNNGWKPDIAVCCPPIRNLPL